MNFMTKLKLLRINVSNSDSFFIISERTLNLFIVMLIIILMRISDDKNLAGFISIALYASYIFILEYFKRMR
jgi:hypothetical protein